MALTIPRHEADLPKWYEAMTQRWNDLPEHLQARLTTIDNTPTTLLSVPIPAGAVYLFDWEVLARQAAGSGTVGDGLVYRGHVAIHLVGSTATLIGSAVTQLSVKDDASWAVAVAGSGNQCVWTVTGNTAKTIGWRVDVNTRRITN